MAKCTGPTCICGSLRCKKMIGIPGMVGPVPTALQLSTYQDSHNQYAFQVPVGACLPAQNLVFPDGKVEQNSHYKDAYVFHRTRKPDKYEYLQSIYKQCKGKESFIPRLYNPLETHACPRRTPDRTPVSMYRELHRQFSSWEQGLSRRDAIFPSNHIDIAPGVVDKNTVSMLAYRRHSNAAYLKPKKAIRACRRPRKPVDPNTPNIVYYLPRKVFSSNARKSRVTREHDDAALHARVHTDITKSLGNGRTSPIEFPLEPPATDLQPMPKLWKKQFRFCRKVPPALDLEDCYENNACPCAICTKCTTDEQAASLARPCLSPLAAAPRVQNTAPQQDRCYAAGKQSPQAEEDDVISCDSLQHPPIAVGRSRKPMSVCEMMTARAEKEVVAAAAAAASPPGGSRKFGPAESPASVEVSLASLSVAGASPPPRAVKSRVQSRPESPTPSVGHRLYVARPPFALNMRVV